MITRTVFWEFKIIQFNAQALLAIPTLRSHRRYTGNRIQPSCSGICSKRKVNIFLFSNSLYINLP